MNNEENLKRILISLDLIEIKPKITTQEEREAIINKILAKHQGLALLPSVMAQSLTANLFQHDA